MWMQSAQLDDSAATLDLTVGSQRQSDGQLEKSLGAVGSSLCSQTLSEKPQHVGVVTLCKRLCLLWGTARNEKFPFVAEHINKSSQHSCVLSIKGIEWNDVSCFFDLSSNCRRTNAAARMRSPCCSSDKLAGRPRISQTSQVLMCACRASSFAMMANHSTPDGWHTTVTSSRWGQHFRDFEEQNWHEGVALFPSLSLRDFLSVPNRSSHTCVDDVPWNDRAEFDTLKERVTSHAERSCAHEVGDKSTNKDAVGSRIATSLYNASVDEMKEIRGNKKHSRE